MRSLRPFQFVPALLLVATAVIGCGNEKPKPDPSAATSASSPASGKGRLNLRTPMAPQVKVDPEATKQYRVDVCYYGTMTLRQARDAYLTSLGGAEPSEKKLPSFGGNAPVTGPGASAAPAVSGAPSVKPTTAPPTAPSVKPTTAPPTAPSAKPAASGAPSAKPAASGAPSAGASGAPPSNEPPRVRPFDIAIRAPHERNARACTVAVGLKDPAMGDVDTALQAYTPFISDLAKAVAGAMNYYQREEYKKDNFAKGKELHKQLVDGFQKLDEMSDKLGAALDAWRKAHAPDPSKLEEGEKAAMAAFNDAREVIVAAAQKKPSVAAFKDAEGRLEKSVEALKAYAQAHGADPWGKIMNPSLDSMLKSAKDAEGKVTDKGIDSDAFLTLTNSFVNVIESRYRALSRATTMKAMPAPSAAPAAPPSGAPQAPHPE